MLDGDHTLEEAWRLRLATFRLSQECALRSIEYCNHAFNLLKTFEGHAHIWTRVFPTKGAAANPLAHPCQCRNAERPDADFVMSQATVPSRHTVAEHEPRAAPFIGASDAPAMCFDSAALQGRSICLRT